MPKKSQAIVCDIDKQREIAVVLEQSIIDEINYARELHKSFLSSLERAFSMEIPIVGRTSFESDALQDSESEISDDLKKIILYNEYLEVIRCHNRHLSMQLKEIPGVLGPVFDVVIEAGRPEAPPPRPSWWEILTGNG